MLLSDNLAFNFLYFYCGMKYTAKRKTKVNILLIELVCIKKIIFCVHLFKGNHVRMLLKTLKKIVVNKTDIV